MRIILAVAFSMCFAAVSGSEERGTFPPHLILSSSSYLPSAPPATPAAGDTLSLYVWQQWTSGHAGGAEFGLVPMGLEVLDVIPWAGYTNEGTITDPILVSSGCGEGVIAEVRVLVVNESAHRLCFWLSEDSGINCSIFCDSDDEYFWHYTFGYVVGALPDCPVAPFPLECQEPISVAPTSWGWVKSLYSD